MQEAVKIISESGIWVFLIGILTSMIIGIVKTPIRAKLIDCLEAGETRTKRENLFDTLVFLSTYVVAFTAATVYYYFTVKAFNVVEISKLSLPIWLSQSLAYGAWKKLGIKRMLGLLAKLIFKDLDHNGEISLDEAISQVVRGIREGKFDVEGLVSTVNDNLAEVVDEVSKASEGTKEADLVKEVADGEVDKMVENLKEKVTDSAKEVADTVLGRTTDGVEVSINPPSVIKF